MRVHVIFLGPEGQSACACTCMHGEKHLRIAIEVIGMMPLHSVPPMHRLLSVHMHGPMPCRVDVHVHVSACIPHMYGVRM